MNIPLWRLRELLNQYDDSVDVEFVLKTDARELNRELTGVDDFNQCEEAIVLDCSLDKVVTHRFRRDIVITLTIT